MLSCRGSSRMCAHCALCFALGALSHSLVVMDRSEIDWHWMRNEPIEGAAFMLNRPVRVIDGPHAGETGTVISLLGLQPEPLYLVELASGADAEIPQPLLRSAYSEHPRGALAELQHWYAAQTDADWEHSYGICIETLDNPGWHVEIDLVDTELAEHAFTEINDSEPEHDWMICRVQEGKFIASGGPLMLERLISTFLQWARTAPESRI